MSILPLYGFKIKCKQCLRKPLTWSSLFFFFFFTLVISSAAAALAGWVRAPSPWKPRTFSQPPTAKLKALRRLWAEATAPLPLLVKGQVSWQMLFTLTYGQWVYILSAVWVVIGVETLGGAAGELILKSDEQATWLWCKAAGTKKIF